MNKKMYEIRIVFILMSITILLLSTKKPCYSGNLEVLLTIQNDTNVLQNDSLQCIISILNQTEDTVAILDRRTVSTDKETECNWLLSIIRIDSLGRNASKYYYLNNMFITTKRPSKKEYVFLCPDSIYNFKFSFCFKELFTNVRNFRKKNEDYGKYQIKVSYFDNFRTQRKSIKGRIISKSKIINFIQAGNE